MSFSYGSASKNVLLQLSMKLKNYKLGTEGLVPFSLVLCEYLKIHTPSETQKRKPTTGQRECMIKISRAEMQQHMEKAIINKALHHSFTAASYKFYQPGYHVID